jgi:hypothetical protein
MKFGIALTAALLLGATLVSGAQQKAKNAPKMTKADWQKMYDKAEEYFNKKDADSIFKFMLPDGKMVMQGQEMSAKQAQAGMKQWFTMMKTLKCEITVTKASQNGNTATVSDMFKETGTMINPKTKKAGKYAGSGTETMTWVWTNGKWMIKKLVINSQTMTLDGKPMPMGG